MLRRILPNASRYFVVTSNAVSAAGHSGRLEDALCAYRVPVSIETIPDGEAHKTIGSLANLYRRAARAGVDRRSVIIGLGGGVITDMAGFLAATYMRGIDFVAAPTTLLGMVDASIGGKTGVDLPEGKNLVGSFWQPRLVWIDLDVLKTLPQREWITGFAEIIKYGVILDREFFSWLEKKIQSESDPRRWMRSELEHAVTLSARMKATVVSADERETPLKGGREVLNFGHTAGHALEAAAGYRRLSHGQAISVGMAIAGQISVLHGLWSQREQLRMLALLRSFGLPINAPRLSASQRSLFWDALRRDKKNVAGDLRFVLPLRIGRVQVKGGVPIESVRAACREAGLYE
jgi:3-dehydroquinate synthase